MAFATGKFSFGLCDYCGQRYSYNTLRKNWRGFMVCPDDYEPKEPQLYPLKYRGDAIALKDPRVDRIEPVTIYLGSPGFSAPFQSLGSGVSTVNRTNMQPFPPQQFVTGVGAVGQVEIDIFYNVLASGVEGNGLVNDVGIVIT